MRKSIVLKNSPILNLFRKCTSSGNYIMPVPNTLKMRKIYDVSEPDFVNVKQSGHDWTRKEIEESLKSNSIDFAYDVFNWRKEVDLCDMEFQQEHFIVKNKD